MICKKTLIFLTGICFVFLLSGWQDILFDAHPFIYNTSPSLSLIHSPNHSPISKNLSNKYFLVASTL